MGLVELFANHSARFKHICLSCQVVESSLEIPTSESLDEAEKGVQAWRLFSRLFCWNGMERNEDPLDPWIIMAVLSACLPVFCFALCLCFCSFLLCCSVIGLLLKCVHLFHVSFLLRLFEPWGFILLLLWCKFLYLHQSITCFPACFISYLVFTWYSAWNVPTRCWLLVYWPMLWTTVTMKHIMLVGRLPIAHDRRQ